MTTLTAAPSASAAATVSASGADLGLRTASALGSGVEHGSIGANHSRDRSPRPRVRPQAEDGLWPLVQDLFADLETRSIAVGALLCLGLLTAIFWATLTNFLFIWRTNENYGHGFFVPLLSLYFANETLKRGRPQIQGGIGLGVTLLVMAMLGRWATVLVPVGIIGDLSFVLGLAGVMALVGGSSLLKRFWFPLLFLLFMVPLPVALYTAIANPLQMMVSKVASAILTLTGIPAYCEGNMMTLPGGIRMFVAEACSGMRQLTGFLALSAAVAYFAAKPAWYRGFLVISSIPIAITANIIRVVVTGWIMFKVDPSYASGALHTLEGMVMLGLGLAMFMAEMWVLNQIFIFDEPSNSTNPPKSLVDGGSNP